jgi:hypothetical protein
MYFKTPGGSTKNDRGTLESGITELGQSQVLIEGHTAFDTYVVIFNPSASAASSGTIIARNSGGGQVASKNFSVNPRSRIQFQLMGDLLAGTGFSGDVHFEINTSAPVAIERSLWLQNFLEGSVSSGLIQPANRWIVPAASDKGDFQTYIHLRAQGQTTIVRTTAFTEFGEVIALGDYGINPHGRVTIAPHQIPTIIGRDYAVRFELVSGAAFYVEKSLYQRPGTPGSFFKSASASAGIPY